MRLLPTLFALATLVVGCNHHRTETTLRSLGGTVPITRAAQPDDFRSTWDVSAGGAVETGVVAPNGGVTSGLPNGSADVSIGGRPTHGFGIRLDGEVQASPSTLRVGNGTRSATTVLGGASVTADGLAYDDRWLSLQVGGTVSVGAMPVVREVRVDDTSTDLCLLLCSGTPRTTTTTTIEQQSSTIGWARVTGHALLTLHAIDWLDISAGITLGNQPMVSGAAFVAIPSLAFVLHASDGSGVVIGVEQPLGTMPWIALPIVTLSVRLGFGGTS